MPHCAKGLALLIGAALLQLAVPAAASEWVVKPQWVTAHEDFLASNVMQGRGSATRDEAIAAQYVAAQFESYGLQPAPGMAGYLQVGGIVIPGHDGEPQTSAETTNAIGYLPGTDPKAGILLVSAHLDHLGLAGDTVMPGANDDASGTTAVLELAHALAAGERMRRGILFVCYGSEELGGLGSRYFGAHPPLPLSMIVANLELEMIGVHDPKMPTGTMMMTGFDRSDFGEMLKRNGALVAPDPYPEQHFFERSDNYSLALRGIVAHTVSGWPLTPTYHRPTDTVANLDVVYMTRAIQSLIDPLRLIANGSETPQWRPGGRPVETK